jgi:transcriptional regulator with XRE-family HTH domain
MTKEYSRHTIYGVVDMPTGSKMVGQLLKELRQKQQMTGEILGRKAHMSQSKISKIEMGYYPNLQINEIERILNILNTPNDIRIRIYREMEQSQPLSLLHKPYDATFAADYYALESKASTLRVFCLQAVPVLLQTTAYRLAALKRFSNAEEDLGTLMKQAQSRQDLLWDQSRSFHFIMHHMMLYTMPTNQRDLQDLQLDRIERMMDMPNIKIGIIPLESGLCWAEVGPFALHDKKTLFMASASGDIVSTDAGNIATYGRVFGELDQLAIYGKDAKALLATAPYR